MSGKSEENSRRKLTNLLLPLVPPAARRNVRGNGPGNSRRKLAGNGVKARSSGGVGYE